jgi:hypothetical protein
MKNPLTVKEIQMTAKELKFDHFAYWLGKASKIELNDKLGICVLAFKDKADFDSMNKYTKHAEIVFTKTLEKNIVVKTVLMKEKHNVSPPEIQN